MPRTPTAATDPTAATHTTAAATPDPAAVTDAEIDALITRGSIRSAMPPLPGHKPRGRPRKDGKPPRQSAAAQHAAAVAAAACQRIQAEPAAHLGTRANALQRLAAAANGDETEQTPAKFADLDLEKRIENLKFTQIPTRAQAFLRAFAHVGHRDAMRAAGLSPLALVGLRNRPEFNDLYLEIRKAHDMAIVANTEDTLSKLANGEFKPRPDCLPPDMRAAGILLPALDPRFRANGQTAAQQVQINIQI